MCPFFRHVCEIAKGNYQLRNICPSLCIEQPDSSWAILIKFDA